MPELLFHYLFFYIFAQTNIKMRYKYIHIFAALFLVAGMSVQFVMSYRQASHHVQDTIDLKNQIVHEKILFELYDAYEVIDQMKQCVAENLSQPDDNLLEAVKRYIGEAEPTDDITLMTICKRSAVQKCH